jgi:hypothetical protein
VQLRGADTTNAFNYYSAVVAALQAIGGTVPSIPAFGTAPTLDYCYGLVSMPPLVPVGHISDWAYAKATLPPLAAVGAISDWARGSAAIQISATGAMTG